MHSWRDSFSEQAQTDYDGLVNAALEPAQLNLGRYNSLIPFTRTVDTQGRPGMGASYPSLLGETSTEAILATLYRGLKEQLHRLRAAATVREALAEGERAIVIDMEHREALPLRIVVPFNRHFLTRRIRTAPMMVMEGERQLWA